MPMTQRNQYLSRSKLDLVQELMERDEADYEVKALIERIVEIAEDDGYRVMRRVELVRDLGVKILDEYFDLGDEDE